MTHHLRKQFQKQISESIEDLDDVEISEEEIEDILEQGLEIDDPDLDLKLITGASLHDAERRESITVHVDMKNILSGSSSLIAGATISNPYVSGLVLLLTFAAIGLPDRHDITPYQALTYGVGWELVDDQHTFIAKTELIEEVVEESRNAEVIENMDHQQVDAVLQELQKMNCLEMREAEDDVLVWFHEEFEVEYK